MAQSRLELQSLLEGITANVYFQPPQNAAMVYPCILYNRDGSSADFADDERYRFLKRYSVTVIDRDPDSPIPDLVEALRYCEFNRFFVADGLNHTIFNLYF